MRRQLGNVTYANALVVASMAIIVHKEGMALPLTFVAMAFGLTIGGNYTVQKGEFFAIIPAGQEVELQGLYTVFSKVLGWAPMQWFGFCRDIGLGGEDNSR